MNWSRKFTAISNQTLCKCTNSLNNLETSALFKARRNIKATFNQEAPTTWGKTTWGKSRIGTRWKIVDEKNNNKCNFTQCKKCLKIVSTPIWDLLTYGYPVIHPGATMSYNSKEDQKQELEGQVLTMTITSKPQEATAVNFTCIIALKDHYHVKTMVTVTKGTLVRGHPTKHNCHKEKCTGNWLGWTKRTWVRLCKISLKETLASTGMISKASKTQNRSWLRT